MGWLPRTARSAARSWRASRRMPSSRLRREPGDRHHRGDADREAGDEEGQAARASRATRGPGRGSRSARVTPGPPPGAGGDARSSRSSRSTRPSRRWICRPARAATAGSWVTSTRVVPSRARSSVSSSRTRRPVAPSRLPVGSSASRIARPGGEGARRGRSAAARRPRAGSGSGAPRSARPTAASNSSARAHGVGEAEQLERQQHVLARGQVGRSWKLWKTKPIFLAAQQRQPSSDIAWIGVPSIRISPEVGRSRPAIRAEQRRLAAARRAEDGDELAGGDREVDVVEDRQLPLPRRGACG